ncbi:MAG: pitrilysin family protein [Myxococcota bacterium]
MTKQILVTDRARPFATLGVAIPRGALYDPPGKAGLAYLTGQMLMRGTVGLNRAEIAETIETLGSNLDVSVGRDHTTFWGDGLTRNQAKFSEVIAKILHRPTFPEAELEKLKRETLAELASLRDDDASLGQRFFVRALFHGHAYGRPVKGTEQTLAGISAADCAAFHREVLTREGVVLGAAGDIDQVEMDRLERELCTPLPPRGSAEPVVAAAPEHTGYRVVLIDKPERTQTQVFIGHMAPHALASDYTALSIGQTTFGGTFTARLSHEVREKRGWSYGAYSYLAGDQRLGTFSVRFYPSEKDTVPALQLVDEMLHAFVADGPTQAEIEAAQSYLQNGHVFSVDTAARRLSELASAELLGHPSDWVDTTVERLRATSPDAIQRAVKTHMKPDDVTVAVVCTAKHLAPLIEQWGRAASIDVVDWKTTLVDG